MSYLRAAGMLALALLLVPLIWQGYSDLGSIIDGGGGRCVLDGDPSRPAGMATLSGTDYEFQEGSAGYCALDLASDLDVYANTTWTLDGEDYQAKYAATFGDGDRLNFPPLAWDWPVTLTWQPELQTLAQFGWGRYLVTPTLGLMPALVLICALAMAVRELATADEDEE